MPWVLVLHSPKDHTKYAYAYKEIYYPKNKEQSETGEEGAPRKRSRCQAHHQQPEVREDGAYVLTTYIPQQRKLPSVFTTTKKL